MAPAPQQGLSPPGSSTYSSNSLYVGDGTWDSTKNTFLLPNLVGLNFETMQYNGMGNRFSSVEQYHYLIRAHGVIAVIAFLFLLPSAIMMARFYSKVPGRGVRVHIYLNILVLGLATVVFILGFMAVGPSRSLTNPHHGIGVAIYVLLLWQSLVGHWIRNKFKKRMYRRPPIKLMLHQWIGRATAILGIVQVPLGLTLYGSPKWTFILYALWMGFLLVLYFVNQYKAYGVMDGGYRTSRVSIEKKKKKSGGFGKFLAPLAAGAGAVLLAKQLGGKDDHDDEVLPSRHGSRHGSRRNSESFIEDEKHDRKEGGGMFKKLLTGAAVAGAGIFAKNYFDKRHDHDEEYSAVAHDTPSRRPSRRHEPAYTDVSESTIEPRRTDDRRGLPAASTAAISAADRPTTPRPTKSPRHPRRTSYDSYTSIASPSRREDDNAHTGRNALLAGLGLGWLGKKLKDRKDTAEQRRLDDIRRQDLDDERRLDSERRHGTRPPRYTGDGRLPPSRRDDWTESDLNTDFTSVHPRPAGAPMPPLSAAAPLVSTSSRQNVVEPLPMPMPAGPPRDSYQDYLDDSRVSRRHSSRGRRDAEAAAAAAGAALAASEAERHRRRERSQSAGGDRRSASRPAAAVKVRVGQQDVTLQRLTREEAAEREARRRRRHSVSDSEVSAGPSGRYRRDADERVAERRAESEAEGLRPLSPPRPAFAGGKVKDSAYYSAGSPGGRPGSGGSVGSPPESRATWSAMSPGGTGLGTEDAAERRRRRRAERAQRGEGGGSVGVEFS